MLDKYVPRGVVRTIIFSNLVSVVLFGLRVVGADNTRYWFLFWNLLLAWLPVLFAWLLSRRLKNQSWKEPIPMLFTLLWLSFLPNSFYLMSDLIHLKNTGDVGILFDIVLFLSFIWNGLLAGIISLVIIHKQLLTRRPKHFATLLISMSLFVSSFAIYLGRSLRWNSWDILLNPAGLLFDISERIINPLLHPQVFLTTLTFFILISSIYWVVWSFLKALTVKKNAPNFSK